MCLSFYRRRWVRGRINYEYMIADHIYIFRSFSVRGYKTANDGQFQIWVDTSQDQLSIKQTELNLSILLTV